MPTSVIWALKQYSQGGAKCLDTCFSVRTRARAVSISVGQGITDLFDRMQGPDAVRARRQTRIRRNTVDVDNGTVEHRDNPLEGVEMAVCADAAVPDTRKRRKFERYETEDGEVFFVDVDTEESVWDLPSDGEEAP